jgi:acetoacetate decarboxylase
MNEHEVRERAFAMPLTSPAYPAGPYRFYHREFLVITYRTDPRKLRELVPEPLEIDAPLVKFEFIRMPDSTGFGDYTESGQVIPSRSRAARAATRIACFSTTIRRSPAAASCGAFPRSSRSRR